jgi:hypothetical protein
MLKIFLLLFVMAAQVSFASSSNFFFEDSDGDHFLISFESEGKFYLDHQLIRPNQLQESVSLQSFASKNDLNYYINKHFPQKKLSKFATQNKNYVSSEVPEVVWEVKDTWSIDWENKFSLWVAENFDKNFFVKYNIETDCADIAFALRWIFSRIHGLPAANTLAGSLVIFSQDSFRKEWLSLKRDPVWHQDEVFLAALKYILRGAFTGTLLIDGYPIEISRETFLVGTIHLQGGHTMVISEIDYDNVGDAPIKKLSSTMPPMVRVLMDEMMIDAEATAETFGGFIRFRWPQKINGKWELVAKENMPFFSREQYTEEFLRDHGHFTLAVIDRLGIDFIPKRIIDRAIDGIHEALSQRLSIVKTGYEYCSQNNCSEGTQAYENHSTPSRDKRLLEQFEGLFFTAEALSVLDSSLFDHLERELNERIFSVDNKSFSLMHWRDIFKNYYFSFHPEDTIEERWAISLDAIQSTILKRFNRYLSQRELRLRDSLSCSTQFDCSRGTQKWRDLNTFDLDQKIKREVFSSYLNLCEKHNCQNIGKKTQSLIKRVPFFVSEPLYPLNIRRGENARDYFVMPQGENYNQLDQKHFLIDNNLWKMSPAFELEIGEVEKSLFHKEMNVFVYLKNNSIHSLNLKTNVRSQKMIEPQMNQIAWLGGKYFSLSKCSLLSSERGDCYFQVWSLENDQLHLLKTYQSPFPQGTNNSLFSFDQTSFLLQYIIKGEKTYSILLDWKIGELKEFDFDTSVSFHGTIDGKHLLTINNDQKVLFEDGKINCIIPLENGISNFISQENLLTLWGEKGTELYSLKSDCSVSLIKIFENGGWMYEAEGNIFISGFMDSRGRYHYRNNLLRKIPFDETSFILAVEPNEMLIATLGGENRFQLKNIFSFNLEEHRSLPVDARYISLKCRFSTYCLSEDSQLSMFWDSELEEAFVLGSGTHGELWSDKVNLNNLYQSETVVIGPMGMRLRGTSIISGSLLEVNGRKIYLPE